MSRESSSSSSRCVSFLRSSCSRRRFSFSSYDSNSVTTGGRICPEAAGAPRVAPKWVLILLPHPRPGRLVQMDWAAKMIHEVLVSLHPKRGARKPGFAVKGI